MLDEMHVTDAFSDINMDDLCFSPDPAIWNSAEFSEFSSNQMSQDDLLTDAMSEFVKYRGELPDLDFLSENVGGTTTGNLSDKKSREKIQDNCPVTYPNIGTSHNSSGYTSGGLSSRTSSPSDSLDLKDDLPIIKPVKFVTDDNTSISRDLKIVKLEPNTVTYPISKPGSQDKPVVFKATYPSTPMGGNNRVRFIVRSKQVVSIQNRNKTINDNSAPGGIKRFPTIGNSRLQPYTIGSSTAFNAPITSFANRPENTISHTRSKHGDTSSVSPSQPFSPSSSDSELHDSFGDDDYMTPKLQTDSGLLDYMPQLKASSTYNPSRSSSPTSRVYNIPFEGTNHNGYFPVSRMSSQHTYSRGQMYSRMRSPLRVDRSESITTTTNSSGILQLSEEEKRTLLAEGYTIPSRFPLTKQEERNLKKVRRKIKNKISAQESRRKKKEYVEALERKLGGCVQENMDLKRRNDSLESTNRSLLGQLRLMQQLHHKLKTGSQNPTTELSGKAASRGTQHAVHAASDYNTSNNHSSAHTTNDDGSSASTCFMVVVLCFAALLVGQPSGQLYNPRASVDTGLMLGPQHHGFLNQLIAHGPGGLVSGSLSQIGYTWSNHRTRSSFANGHTPRHSPGTGERNPNNASLHATKGPSQSMQQVPSHSHWGESHDLKPPSPVLEATEAPPPNLVDTSVVRDESHSKPAPQSRLLGAPSEWLDASPECKTHPRPSSFWSSLWSQFAGSRCHTVSSMCARILPLVTSSSNTAKHSRDRRDQSDESVRNPWFTSQSRLPIKRHLPTVMA